MGALFTGLAAVALVQSASAADLGLRPAFPRDAAATAGRRVRGPSLTPSPERLLELWVDGRNRGVVARVRQEGGRLLVASEDLAAAGLTGGSGAMTPLADIGVTGAEVREATQQLFVNTRDGPDRQVLDLGAGRAVVRPRADTGFILRYDLAALTGGRMGDWSAAAALGASVFTPAARLDARGWARANTDVARFVRLDTALAFEDAARMRRLNLGDGLTSQLGWSRAVRFAGVQLARDFALQPQLPTLPPIQFLGQAAAPSSVDVFVGAARVYTGHVEPGPFEVRDIPVVTGRGEATVVVRDVLGRDVTATLPFFGAGELLAPGLGDYSLEAGLIRRGYGVTSFDYGAPVAMATWRRGVSERATVQAHLEASPRAAVAGGGASARVGRTGVAGAALALSGGEEGAGLLYAASYRGEYAGLRLFGSAVGTAGEFADVVAAEEGAALPSLRLQLGATMDVGRRGALSGAWISQRGEGPDIDLATGAYSFSLPGGWYLGASGLYDASRDEWAGQLFVRLPLSEDISASASAQASPNGPRQTVRLSKAADPDGGTGWALTASPSEERLGAQGQWYGRRAAASAAVESAHGQVSARLLASGALVGMDGTVMAARNAEGGLALVKTGRPGVRVYRENRPVAVTDENGRALLAGLAPNVRNHVGVRLADLAFDAEAGSGKAEVTPRDGAGVVVDFTPPRTRPVLLVIRDADGAFPPAGALLALDGGGQVVVGHRGQAFVRDMDGPVSGLVRGRDGACRLEASPPPDPDNETIPRLDVTCRKARL